MKGLAALNRERESPCQMTITPIPLVRSHRRYFGRPFGTSSPAQAGSPLRVELASTKRALGPSLSVILIQPHPVPTGQRGRTKATTLSGVVNPWRSSPPPPSITELPPAPRLESRVSGAAVGELSTRHLPTQDTCPLTVHQVASHPHDNESVLREIRATSSG